MGGYGSGSYRGWRKKPTVEGCPQVHISKIKPNLSLGQEQATITFKLSKQSHTVNLTWTRCNYGGQRPWFVCPRCGQRAGVLYLKALRIACRTCHNLTYAMSQSSHLERPTIQNQRLCRRLGAPGQNFMGATLPPIKPKGMHWRTYSKLCGRIAENDRKRQSIVLGEMRALLRRLGHRNYQ